jgi:hypothetical protein
MNWAVASIQSMEPLLPSNGQNQVLFFFSRTLHTCLTNNWNGAKIMEHSDSLLKSQIKERNMFRMTTSFKEEAESLILESSQNGKTSSNNLLTFNLPLP